MSQSIPTCDLAKADLNRPNEQVPGVQLSDAGSVTIAALLHLVRLMGAEIVLARPDCDPTPFEQAVRAKLSQFSSPTGNKQAIHAGIDFAQSLVAQVLFQIRGQAEVKQRLKVAAIQTKRSDCIKTGELPSKLLN